MPSRNNIFIKQKRGKTTALMATFKTTSTLTMTSTTSLFASTRFRRSCQSKIEFQSIKPHQWEGNMQQIHQQNTYTRLFLKPPSTNLAPQPYLDFFFGATTFSRAVFIAEAFACYVAWSRAVVVNHLAILRLWVWLPPSNRLYFIPSSVESL